MSTISLTLRVVVAVALSAAADIATARQEAVTVRPALHGSAPSILRDLAPAWAQDFAQVDPAGVVLAQPFGPPQGALDTGLADFLVGKSDFAFLTREIAEVDLAAFRRAHRGSDPVVIPVAGGAWNRFGLVDAVIIIVNRANPIERLSFGQLAQIFFVSLTTADAALDWGAFGNAGWHGRAVHLVGGGAWAGEESARALTIRRHVLEAGGRHGIWRLAPESGGEADVVARVGHDPLAIGFTGFGHISGDVRVVAIAATDGGPANLPSRSTATSGRYPLLRSVDLLFARNPDGSTAPALIKFADYLTGRRGQTIVRKTRSFLPLTRAQRRFVRDRITAMNARSIAIRSPVAETRAPAATIQGDAQSEN